MALESLMNTQEAVWLRVKRWDHDIITPTAVKHLNCSDDGSLYSVSFYGGFTQIVGGYGKYWWCYDKKPKGDEI